MMVFDERHNGIPVAFILTSRCDEADLTPWMKALNAKMLETKPDWKPTAFIVDCAQGEINAIKYVSAPFSSSTLCHVHRNGRSLTSGYSHLGSNSSVTGVMVL